MAFNYGKQMTILDYLRDLEGQIKDCQDNELKRFLQGKKDGLQLALGVLMK